MMGVSYKVKKYFFDRAKVQRLIGERRARFLRNAGGFVQKTAQRSMRRVGKKGKPSPVGQPPRWHGDANFSLRKILFAYDPAIDGMLVGPVIGNKKARPTAPELQELGGQTTILEKRVGATWVPLGRRRRPGQPVRKRRAQYPPRPFMRPALAKTMATNKFPGLWSDRGAAAA